MRISPIDNSKTTKFSSTDRTVYYDKQKGRYSLPNYTTSCFDKYYSSIFLQEPDLWLEQVKQDYDDYKLTYGMY